jgi:hypothetical protein
VRSPLPAATLAAALLLAGCQARTGRVMEEDEPVGVSVDGASYDILDGMMKEAVPKILTRVQDRLAAAGATERMRLIFAGVQNNTDERLGEKKDYVYDTVDILVGRTAAFDMVSRTFVEEVMDRMKEPPRSELLIDPEVRRRVVQQFEQDEGRDYIRFILWGKFNNATSDTGSGTSEKKYALVLEMVDVRTGLEVKEQVFARKAYTR